MTNRHRGDIALDLGGRRHVLRLSLQALAEIEDAFAADGLEALGKRLGQGRLRSAELTRIVAALMRGGGGSLSDNEVAGLIEARDLPDVITAIAQVFASAFPEEAGGTASVRP